MALFARFAPAVASALAVGAASAGEAEPAFLAAAAFAVVAGFPVAGDVACAVLADPWEEAGVCGFVGAAGAPAAGGGSTGAAALASSQSEKEALSASCAGGEDCGHCAEEMESAALPLTSDAELGTWSL